MIWCSIIFCLIRYGTSEPNDGSTTTESMEVLICEDTHQMCYYWLYYNECDFNEMIPRLCPKGCKICEPRQSTYVAPISLSNNAAVTPPSINFLTPSSVTRKLSNISLASSTNVQTNILSTTSRVPTKGNATTQPPLVQLPTSNVTSIAGQKNVTVSLKRSTTFDRVTFSSVKINTSLVRPNDVFSPAELREALRGRPVKLSNLIFSNKLPDINFVNLAKPSQITIASDSVLLNDISITTPNSIVITHSTRGQTINSPTAVSVTKPTSITIGQDPFLLSSYAVTLKHTKNVRTFVKNDFLADPSHWTEWTSWGKCIVGRQFRMRKCDKLDTPKYCQGSDFAFRLCIYDVLER